MLEIARSAFVLTETDVDAWANNNGYALEADVVLLDGTQAMTGNLDLGTNSIVNVVDPTNPQDAATKNYVDTEITSAVSGLSTDSIAGGDGNTMIQTDEGGANDDIIRFDTAGSERMVIDASGNVGVGSSSPRSPFEVAGEIQIGNTLAACDGTKVGAIRYNTGNVEFCDGGGTWVAFGTAAGGEVNTGSNLAGAGVGVFDSKNVADLRFRNIAAEDSKVDITLNSGDIEVGVREGNFDPALIPNTPAGSITATNVQAALNELDTLKLGAIDNEASLANANIWVGDGLGVAQEVAVTGDVVMANTGATTIQANAVESSMILDGEIVDADINASANITASKLGTGVVDNTEFNFLDGVTSAIQTQIDGKEDALGYTPVNQAGDTMSGLLTMDAVGGASGDGGSIVFRELVGNGTEQTGFRAPDALGTDLIYELPGVAPTAGQVLSSDASGLLSWVDNGAGAGDFMANGSVAMTGQLDAIDGTAAAPGISFASDQDTGVYRSAADEVSVSTGGSQRMVVDATGNIGIGTTSPGADLDIVKTNPSGTVGMVIQNLSADPIANSMLSIVNDDNSGRLSLGVNSSGEFLVPGQSQINSLNDLVVFAGSNTEQLFLESSSGNVGIGTTGPGAKLDVEGDIVSGPKGTAAGDGGEIRFEELAANEGVAGIEYVGFSAPDAIADGDEVVWQLPAADGTTGQVLSTNGSGVLSWTSVGTGDFESDGSVSMTGQFLAIGGSVGAPGISFDGDTDTGIFSTVADTIGFSVGGGARYFLDDTSLSSYLGTSFYIRHLVGNASTPTYSFTSTTDSGMFSPGIDMIAFSNNGVESLRIDASGNVGIGNTTPNVALDVNGSIEYTGTLTDMSDRRLKEDIMPLENSLDKILAIEGVSFVMKGDADRRVETGVIAQQVEPIVPELVHTADDEMQTKSVNYIGFIGYIMEAIKELAAYVFDKNAEQDRELASLKQQNQELLEVIKKQQQQLEEIHSKLDQK
jgi:hypothetical protein